MIELLAPAGNLEKLKIAVHYGADAVYFGGRKFNLRAQAGNFSESDMKEAVKFAHEHGVRVYVTVNIFARNNDLDEAGLYIAWLEETGVDALIISDPGIFRIAAKAAPDTSIHISTQANVTNLEAARFWGNLGARRVNLARELSIREIREICSQTDIETEVFVHGALCISYSGRCMLSLYMTGRDANQGACAHPCRYRYRLEEEKRPGRYFPVEEDSRGTYIFNTRDLCLVKRLPELVKAGVASLKIEGRMKGIFYVATIVRAYRAALDYLREYYHETGKEGTMPEMPSSLVKEIKPLGSRGYTENFFDTPPDCTDMLYQGRSADQTFSPAATVVRGGNMPLLKIGHILRPGDCLEYMEKGTGITPFKILEVRRPEGQKIKQALGGDVVTVITDPEIRWEEWAVIRKRQK